MKLFSVIGVTLALFCVSASSATAESGMLDPEFGSGGKVTTTIGLGAPWSQASVQLAEAPGGGIVVATGTKVIRYQPDGKLDPSFGSNGAVSVALPGRRRFELGDLGVDPEGRIVVIGTATASGSSRSPQPSLATVLRYLPDGGLDPAFGGGDGIVMTDFGLRSSPSSAAAAVTASLGGVDRWDQITLVVGTVQPVARCGGPARLRRRDRLIARLTPAGHRDRFFGDHGVQRIDPLERVASLAFSTGGETVLAGPAQTSCGQRPEIAVISLRQEGARRLGFGEHGTRRLTGSAAAIAVDQRGRTVVLCKEKQRRARNEHSTKVVRLLPDGELDPDFSGGWIVYTFQGPLYKWSSLAIDSNDQPVLVGTLVKPLQEGNATRFHRWLVVIPLRQNGRLQSSFGWQGWLAITRFDPRSDAAASEALIDGENRLLIAGTAHRPGLAPHGGLALVRYGL